MNNETTGHTSKSGYIINVQMAVNNLFQGLQSLCRREKSVHQCSVILRTGLQQTYSGGLRVCVRE